MPGKIERGVLVLNSPHMMCCGLPRAECTCGRTRNCECDDGEEADVPAEGEHRTLTKTPRRPKPEPRQTEPPIEGEHRMMGLSENEATDDPLDFESARERYDPFVLNRKAEASADDDGSEFLSRRVEQSHCVFFGNRVPLADDGLVENIGHEPLDDEPLDLPSMPWRR